MNEHSDAVRADTQMLERDGADERPWRHVDRRESGVNAPPPVGTGQEREPIEQALSYQLSAAASYTFAPDGLSRTISIPVSLTTLELDEHA
ncbi:hypothetical protein LQG66_32400 [Bradyrhizobium ontarionense]|uniref:Uncharacterized protein n=1 Tax=Bradyrhizobium ontarionense TaxID=2898149 RepID=A0ABY3R918_9BRAD|nr:hypothetical protein [Bradyrhizobium sp. A19]UFZ03849.1 hypothetical protein LQG66_32400 [Bradyrhizobium sp. A19]